jgi:hypothetical protein
MAAARRIANPIAVRRYGVDGEPGCEVVLTIGKPQKDPRLTKTWTCAVRIEGIPKQKHHRGYGADAVQALQDAMVCARRELDASGLRLTWLGGEPGALGLPLPAPMGWGLAFQQRIERYIQRESLKHARALAAAGEAKMKRRARRKPPEEGPA